MRKSLRPITDLESYRSKMKTALLHRQNDVAESYGIEVLKGMHTDALEGLDKLIKTISGLGSARKK